MSIYKKTWITLLLLMVNSTFNIHAQLLWKISGNGLEAPSYLFGTHHLAPLSVTENISGFQTAYNHANQIIGEVSMPETQTPATMQLMQNFMTMPADTTLHMLFTENEFELINQYTKENLNLDMNQTPNFRPAFISNSITLMIYMKQHPEYNPQQQMDAYFQMEALKQGKKIAGLESIEFQFDLLFNGSSVKRQAETLVCLLTDIDQTVRKAEELTAAYMEQDLEKMLRLSEERDGTQCDPLPGEMESMIDNRNIKWVKLLPEMLQQQSNFIAVGALHLPGENGLISLLQKAGFTLDPIK